MTSILYRHPLLYLTRLPAPRPTPRPLTRALCSTTPPSAMPPKVSNLRVNYTSANAIPTPPPQDPLPLFESWISTAVNGKDPEPNAMCLSTVSPTGRPSARMVLLKHFSTDSGFVWYTNYDSLKSQHLHANPFAALTFWWPSLERSVRVEGQVAKVPEEESDEYFYSRPPESQLGALASDQSRLVPDRDVLEKRWIRLKDEYLDETGGEKKKIQRPAHWGGFRLIPDRIEFWKGREARLHDRILYVKESGEWRCNRLQP